METRDSYKYIYRGKGTHGNPKNDRSITITSNILKIMEKFIQNRIMEYIYASEYLGGGRNTQELETTLSY